MYILLLPAVFVILIPTGNGISSEPAITDGPSLLQGYDPKRFAISSMRKDSIEVPIGMFFTTPIRTKSAIEEPEVAKRVRTLLAEANTVLAKCNLYLQVEAVQVVTLPDRLLNIQGNRKGSWGGHPPAGTKNPDLFSYRQNERLTEEARELFTYGKKYTRSNTIAVFPVREIEYYIGNQRTTAYGLSFPPNDYRHPNDYPLRNSVLLVGGLMGGVFTGDHGYSLAHELAHMLLNSGGHIDDRQNLMGNGIVLTATQCARMRKNRSRLYGKSAVPDPGPPVREKPN